MMIRYLVLCLCVVVASAASPTGTGSTPTSAPKSGDKAPTRLTRQNYLKVAQGERKLTESDVEAILGPPSFVRLASGFDYDAVWEEATSIRVEFSGGKVTELTGRFSPHVESKSLTRETFRKLSAGMTEAEVEKVLGQEAPPLMPSGAGSVRTWERANRIVVQFKDGKVRGYAWLEYRND